MENKKYFHFSSIDENDYYLDGNDLKIIIKHAIRLVTDPLEERIQSLENQLLILQREFGLLKQEKTIDKLTSNLNSIEKTIGNKKRKGITFPLQ
jgi:hypothetical protein